MDEITVERIAIENLQKLDFYTGFDQIGAYVCAQISTRVADAIKFSLGAIGIPPYIKDFSYPQGYNILEGANGFSTLSVNGSKEIAQLAKAGIHFPGSDYFRAMQFAEKQSFESYEFS